MNGYEYLNAAQELFFHHEEVNKLIYSALSEVIDNKDIAEHVRVGDYVGKILHKEPSNFYFLVLYHSPTKTIVVLEDFVVRFGKKQSVHDAFRFPLSLLKEKNPVPEKFYVLKTLSITKPATNLVTRIRANLNSERANQVTSSERVISELIQALGQYSQEILEFGKSCTRLIQTMNVLKAASMREMAFGTAVDNEGKPLDNEYNLAFSIERIRDLLVSKKFVISELAQFGKNKSTLRYCDTDYSISLLDEPGRSNTRIIIKDQNCGFIIDYKNAGDYVIVAADLGHTDAGLGSYKKATSLEELCQALDSQDDVLDPEFLSDYAAVVVKSYELEYISGSLAYCVFLDIEGAIDAIEYN